MNIQDLRDIPDGGWARIDGTWYVRPPGTRMAASIAAHTVTEHDDGTITVHPSVEYSTGDRGDYWHGWLRAGVWTSV